MKDLIAVVGVVALAFAATIAIAGADTTLKIAWVAALLIALWVCTIAPFMKDKE